MPLKLGARYSLDKVYTAHIKLLDNTVLDINLPLKAKGKDCLEKIVEKLGLHEADYFGIQFLTKKEKLRWVDLDKSLRKQLDRYAFHRGRNPLLVFKVQYFVVNIGTLKQEITRYLLYLQLKLHILSGRLKCNFTTAVDLASLAVQAEFGDYDSEEHSSDFLEEFFLMPHYHMQSETHENVINEVLAHYREKIGLTPDRAEEMYIKQCQQLQQFGVEFFDGKDKDGIPLEIGPGYHGIKVCYPNQEKQDVLFRWTDISNMAFNRQNFVLTSSSSPDNVVTQLNDMETSKYFWRLCVNQHQFFRMSHSTIGKTAFRTQHELSTDPNLYIRLQKNSPPITRRMTLTKKKVKKLLSNHSNKSNEEEVAHLNSDRDTPIIDESIDETEFLHRYEDICRLSRDQRGSSSTSRGSTPASSEYNTSDTESEGDCRSFHIPPFDDEQSLKSRSSTVTSRSAALNGERIRPVSLIFTRLNKIEMQQRDELLRHLESYIQEHDLANEYQQIFTKKMNCTFTTATENSALNRHKKYLPYDDNRIILNPNLNFETSTYINASPIKVQIDSKTDIQYIASQSPLTSTVNNFWQMVWEQEVGVIVMVTKENENGEEKCCRYWERPENGKTSTFSQISVTTNFQNQFTSYTVRSLLVKNIVTNRKRTIFQLQFHQWPENNNIPTPTKFFIDFLDEIHSLEKVSKEMNKGANISTLVHCEDGVTRTGVVILTQLLLTVIEKNEVLDIPLSLGKLRTQRMALVTSVDHYKFIYSIIIAYMKRNRLI